MTQAQEVIADFEAKFGCKPVISSAASFQKVAESWARNARKLRDSYPHLVEDIARDERRAAFNYEIARLVMGVEV